MVRKFKVSLVREDEKDIHNLVLASDEREAAAICKMQYGYTPTEVKEIV